MLLVFSTADFKVNNIPYEGFPIIVDDTTGQVHEPTLNFLIYYCIKRGRCQSVKSWKPYGQAMYDYLSFLQANDMDWREFHADGNRDSTIIAGYRDWSLSECGLSAVTINQRLRVIVKFYQYALRHDWIASLPYLMEEVFVRQSKGFLAHVNSSGGVVASPDVMLRQQKTTIKVLTSAQVNTLLNVVENSTHKLMVRLGLATGLRREEIATFPVKYIFNPATMPMQNDEQGSIQGTVRVHLSPNDMKTKGDKERAIDVSVALMADLWEYTLHERHQLESIHDDNEPVLFLNHQGRAYANEGKGLNNILNRLNLPFKVHPHILRHTYATHTLHDMRAKKSKTDPLLYVKNRLGHASITTTEQYLHLLDEIQDDLMTDYQQMIDKEVAIA
jgi:site-specific recombinase XerD